ncbi:MAG: dihydrofolate reductase [Bacilli bacterium]|nr:dihydrofolate reductase [Bacilli bacterium]MBQ9731424.1 dihydrofolate reductase [Bacilli bacterium]
MFNKLVAIEPINIFDKHKEELKMYAKEVILFQDMPKNDIEIINRIADADAVLLSYTSSISSYVLEHVKNVKYIGMCCSLYSIESANVDIKKANELGITVTGVRDYGDEGVAEYIIHELVEFLQGYKEYKWDTIGHEITGLKCGVIGLGTSGTLIAKTLKFFKADVSYYSRTRKPNLEEELQITYKDLNSLCKDSEAIFLALNKNVFLLQKEQFDLMKGKRILFNTSIGPGFDVDALKNWLKENNHYFFGDTLATAGDESIWKLPNTFTINRSSGGKTYQAYLRLGEKVINNIKDFQNKKSS